MTEPAPESTEASLPIKAERRERRKYAKRQKPAVAPKPTKADELAGVTRADCAVACKVGHCVITETRFCGHPYKSSHGNPDRAVVERIERAKRMIAHQAIEKTDG